MRPSAGGRNRDMSGLETKIGGSVGAGSTWLKRWRSTQALFNAARIIEGRDVRATMRHRMHCPTNRGGPSQTSEIKIKSKRLIVAWGPQRGVDGSPGQTIGRIYPNPGGPTATTRQLAANLSTIHRNTADSAEAPCTNTTSRPCPDRRLVAVVHHRFKLKRPRWRRQRPPPAVAVRRRGKRHGPTDQ